MLHLAAMVAVVAAPMSVTVTKGADGSVTMANGFVSIEAGKSGIRAKGDLQGVGAYGKDVLTGVRVESFNNYGVVTDQHCPLSVAIVKDDPKQSVISVTGMADVCDGSTPGITEDWTVTLDAGSRFLSVAVKGKSNRTPDKATRRVFVIKASSIYALYSRGVVQMRQGEMVSKSYYGSNDRLPTLYALGGFGGDLHTAGNASLTITTTANASSTVLGSFNDRVEFHNLVSGSFSSGLADLWVDHCTKFQNSGSGLMTYATSFEIAANNHDFPFLGDCRMSDPSDLAAFMTGIYASPVGNLRTHDNAVQRETRVGQIATTIHRPSEGYADNYNFFDPDNYLSTSAMLFSGDRYIQEQVRTVVERSGSFLDSKGQLPHHFQNVYPVYQALSGEIQTGPNVFWILSCFNYARYSGNIDWLKSYMPTIRKAAMFLFGLLDVKTSLVNAPGSLMIDVFIRNQFTTDSNAMLVGFFREFGEAEYAVGNTTGGDFMHDLSKKMSQAVMENLWSGTDHFITQRNLDNTTRDFVDYDANLIATAHGIATPQIAEKVFARIDGGRCPASHSWVSEKYYGPRDTTNGNIGDSWTAMGRIAWFDALSRKLLNTEASKKHFYDVIYNPMKRDLLKYTWMHERYNCDGTQMANRTAMYFEYPSVTAMLLHRVKYGIDLGLNTFEISPFGPTSFDYSVGSITVTYSSEAVSFSIPGTGNRKVTITGLTPSKAMAYSGTGCAQPPSGSVTTTKNGIAEFTASIGDSQGSCHITLK